MKISVALTSTGMILGFLGAGIIWWVGRKEGPGLPFLADAEGRLLKEIAFQNRRRQSIKNGGMALIAISFLLQFFALFF